MTGSAQYATIIVICCQQSQPSNLPDQRNASTWDLGRMAAWENENELSRSPAMHQQHIVFPNGLFFHFSTAYPCQWPWTIVVWNYCKLVPEWSGIIVGYLPKKRGALKIGDFRPVACICTKFILLLKIIDKSLDQAIDDWGVLDEAQESLYRCSNISRVLRNLSKMFSIFGENVQ